MNLTIWGLRSTCSKWGSVIKTMIMEPIWKQTKRKNLPSKALQTISNFVIRIAQAKNTLQNSFSMNTMIYRITNSTMAKIKYLPTKIMRVKFKSMISKNLSSISLWRFKRSRNEEIRKRLVSKQTSKHRSRSTSPSTRVWEIDLLL